MSVHSHLTEMTLHRPKGWQTPIDVSDNVMCFRYYVDSMEPWALDALNEELVFRLHEQGMTVPSCTEMEGARMVRVCMNTCAPDSEDFDDLVREVLRLGWELEIEAAELERAAS